MDNQNYKKTFLGIALTILGIGLFWISPAFAVDNLEIEFEETPLFNQANFLPGESITRWVKVTNNSGETQRIATEAINVSDPDGFGNALTLEIKEGDESIYNGPLSQFFNIGELYLSDLTGNGVQTQYDFTVIFYPGANNAFQGKTLGFDVLIGFQGTEGGVAPGGGGGYLPPGLTITNESTEEVEEDSVTITWLTNYLSTSQVIYAEEGKSHTLDLTDNTDAPPKYGYAQTTPEYNTSTKITDHSITITSLIPNTTYYYRCISHGSLAVSTEYSFTTLGVKPEEEEIKEEVEEKGIREKEEEEKEEEKPGPIVGEEEEEEEEEEGEEEIVIGEEKKEEEKPKKDMGWLLATIGNLFKLENLWWILILFVAILIVLFLLRKKRRSRRIEKEI